MKDFNWTQARTIEKPPLRITVSKTQLHIPDEMFIRMGRSSSFLILYDAEARAIKLAPDKGSDSRKVATSRGKYHHLSTTIGKHVMPTGVYAYLPEEESFVFQFREPPLPKGADK